jgi:yecA family protein
MSDSSPRISPQKLKSQILSLSHSSAKNPGYFFIQGYFVGLAATPTLIMPSVWISDLFGEFKNEQQLEYLSAVNHLYNQQMEMVLTGNLKLPSQCALSKSDISESLKTEAPLPQWCLGMLKALKLIDKPSLNKTQQEELKTSTTVLRVFSGFEQANEYFSKFPLDVSQQAHALKKQLSMFLSDLIYEMRFNDIFDEEFEADFDPDFEPLSEVEEEFNNILDFALYDDSPEGKATLNNIINEFEKIQGQEYFQQNRGYFWTIHETRPYMLCRARRALNNFLAGQIDLAIDELMDLVELNPMDNQANRYPLFNYLVIAKRWEDLERVMQPFDEQSIFTLSAQALMCFAKEGDSPIARAIKKLLLTQNKHFVLYLTGQRAAPKHPVAFFQPGDKTEVFVYLDFAGKQAWRSVEGSLFWLRKK